MPLRQDTSLIGYAGAMAVARDVVDIQNKLDQVMKRVTIIYGWGKNPDRS